MADSTRTDLCQEAVTLYLGSLRDEFATTKSEFGCIITTPFLRPDGDCLALTAELLPNGQVALTDGGETFAYLYLSGLVLSRKLQDDARRIGARYGVSVVNVNELGITVDAPRLGDAVHGLVQATINVAALIEKRRPYLNLRFDEAVEAAIIGHGKLYDPDYAMQGAKEQHTVRFRVDSDLRLLVEPLSRVNPTQARHLTERWNYHFTDIKTAQHDWSCVAVLDDRGERSDIWSPHVLLPLEGVATIVRWEHDRERLDALLEGEVSLHA